MYALTFTESYYQDSPGCTEDHECSWCEQPSGHVNVEPGSLHRERRNLGGHYQIAPDGYESVYEVQDVPVGAMAYLVVVEYTDGGTFGYDGYWCVPGLYSTPEEAEECRKRCEAPNDVPTRALRPWDGYFASLGSARVEPMVVLV
jgi:hypothetical protein